MSGLIVTGLLVLQTIVGLVSHFTWYPGKATHAIDRWHAFIGKFAMFGAWATVLTGCMQLNKEGYSYGAWANSLLISIFGVVFFIGGALESHFEVNKTQKYNNHVQVRLSVAFVTVVDQVLGRRRYSTALQ